MNSSTLHTLPCRTTDGGSRQLVLPILLLSLLPALVFGQVDYLPYAFKLLAGSPSVGDADGIGNAARFRSPKGVAVDAGGTVYVADAGAIRKISPLGVVSTWTGLKGPDGSAAPFASGEGLALDAAGNLFVAASGNSVIFKITPGDVETTVANLAGTSGPLGPLRPIAVAADAAGNLYFCCFFDHAIRKIAPDGTVTTLAGNATESGSADGPGSAARFAYPEALAVDTAGNVYVADTGNCTIRKITPDGTTTTLAGLANASGSADGMGSAARFSRPYGVAVDVSGVVYVADLFDFTIRRITPDGVVTTLAGLAGTPGGRDGSGSDARFDSPYGVAVDIAGNVYATDYWNATIRKITPDGTTITLAGLSRRGSSADGTGSAAHFSQPTSLAVDAAGFLYVADSANHTIRKITPTGVVTTLAGVAGVSGSADGTGSAARFYEPTGVAVAASGDVLVADYRNHTIRKITPVGTVTTLAGLAGTYGAADGIGSAARFDFPSGVATDAAGNVYVADTRDNVVWTFSLLSGWITIPPSGMPNPCPAAIRKVTPDGSVTTVGYASRDLSGVAANPHGDVFYAANAEVYDYDNGISGINRINANGTVTPVGIVLSRPCGIAADSSGVYVAETYNQTISKFSAAGVRATLVDPTHPTTAVGGTAGIGLPKGVAVDAAGNVYVSDIWNNTILKGEPYPFPLITKQPASRAVTAGQGAAFTIGVGSSSAATFQWQRQARGSTTWASLADDTRYRGTATATLNIATTSTAMDGDRLRCVIVNANGSIISDPVTLAVMAGRPLIVTTLAGQAGVSGRLDGTGSAARFFVPTDVTVDAAGSVYVADTANGVIRKVTPDAEVTTLAGAVRFGRPSGVGLDTTGNVYVSDTDISVIRKITPDGLVTTLAGRANTPGSADGIGSAARFNGPSGIVADAAGNVYVADTLNGTIRKIAPDGTVTSPGGPFDIPSPFSGPQGIALDGAGALYVANANSNSIQKLVLTSEAKTTIAGGAGLGAEDGAAAAATFRHPSGVAIDGSGNVFVADTDNHTIRQIAPDGTVTTIAGIAGVSGSADGVGTAVRFNYPAAIAADANGNLYIADSNNHTIRLAYFAAAPAITAQPESTTMTAGGNTQFSVTASGKPAPTFQWYFNGAVISGATSGTLSLANVQAANAGSYSVTVTNDAGSATSNAATLTVNAAPTSPSAPGGSASSGSGAMEAWFAGLLMLLAAARVFSRFS